MASFGPIAPHYDSLMSLVPYKMWASYYQLLLAHQDLRPRRLLDVCCGTGILAEQFAREGYTLAGIDLSAPMIEEARRKAERHHLAIRYEVADAATFDLGERFDAAYSFFDSLNYIVDPTQLAEAMHRVAEHLTPGGSWIFDLNTAYAFETKMFDQQDTRNKTAVKNNWVGDYNAETRVIEVAMEFWVDGGHFREIHVQRAHSHDEIVEMLEDAGFGAIRAYSSYTLDPPRKKADRLHYTAIRI